MKIYEAKDNNGKYYSFKRYKSQDEKDRSFNDGSQLLDDIAYLTSFADIRDGDLVKLTDEGLRNEEDDYFSSTQYEKQWFEVVGVDRTGAPKSDEDFEMTIRVVPVNDYGMPFTKAQIRKVNPKWADKLEKYGYVDYINVRKYEDESLSMIPKVLVVSTEDVPNWDYRGNDPKKMSYGRYIRSAPEGEEELYDDMDRPTGKFEKWPRGGNAEVRKAAFDRQKQADERAKGRADRKKAFEDKYGDLIDSAENPFVNRGMLAATLQNYFPDADESAVKKIVDEAKNIGYGKAAMSEDELEQLCAENGIDPQVVNIISGGAASSFSTARMNHNNS